MKECQFDTIQPTTGHFENNLGAGSKKSCKSGLNPRMTWLGLFLENLENWKTSLYVLKIKI